MVLLQWLNPSVESVCYFSPQRLYCTSSRTLKVIQSTDKLHPALLNNQWWFCPDHSTAPLQWYISTWPAIDWVSINPRSMFCVCVCLCVHQWATTRQSLSSMQSSTATCTGLSDPLLSPVVWAAKKLSESYSYPTLNEAHLQEQTVPSLSTVRTPMNLPWTSQRPISNEK